KLVSRALRVDSNDRYQSAAEMLSDLQAIPIQHSREANIADELEAESTNRLVEYLFVDHDRLRSYLEQFETRESTQTHPSGRPLSVHEKVLMLSKRLARKNLQVPHRPINFPEVESHRGRFCVETMTARRAYIPLGPATSTFPALHLWVSLRPDTVTISAEDGVLPGSL